MTCGTLTKKLDSIAFKKANEQRDYLGATTIGHDCLRRIWYEHNGYKKDAINPRTNRIFMVGKKLESMIVDLLRETNMTIVSPDKANNFLEYRDKHHEYIKGHCDAIILNPQRILEIKTANNASFNQFYKNGLAAWNQQYYAQIQLYMGMSGIHRAIILVMNKDNCEFWDEEITYSPSYYLKLIDKAVMVAESPTPPPRIGLTQTFYKCKMCSYREVCSNDT